MISVGVAWPVVALRVPLAAEAHGHSWDEAH